MKTVDLFNVDGSVLVETIDVPVLPEGDQDVIVRQDRFYKKIDTSTYWECVAITVL